MNETTTCKTTTRTNKTQWVCILRTIGNAHGYSTVDMVGDEAGLANRVVPLPLVKKLLRSKLAN